MESLEKLIPWWNYLQQLGSYSQQCAGLPIHTLGCKNFWIWMDFLFVGIALLICAPIIIHNIKKIQAYKSYKKWLEEQVKIADPETMAKIKWSSPESRMDKLSQDEAAKIIRQHLESKTNKNSL